MVSSTLRAGSEAHTTLGRNSSLTRGHHPHPPSPCSRQRARGGRVSISCAVTYVGNVGKALCAKQPNSRFFCKIPYPSGHQSHPLLPPARGGAAFLFLSLWKKTGGQAPVAVRDWVSIEVHDLAVLSTGHARGLRLGGSRDLRLRRLSDQGARWFGVGKKVVSSSVRAGSEAHTTLGRNSSLTRGHHPHPPSPCSRQRARGGPRFYILRGDLCWKRRESTLCETAQQPVLLHDPLPVAACRVERHDPRADVVAMVVVGPTRKHVLVDHARLIDIDPATDL